MNPTLELIDKQATNDSALSVWPFLFRGADDCYTFKLQLTQNVLTQGVWAFSLAT